MGGTYPREETKPRLEEEARDREKTEKEKEEKEKKKKSSADGMRGGP